MVRARIVGMSKTSYAELQCTSNFSFLRGASHPEELAMQAKHLGLAALAVTDRNTLAGVVRAHAAAKDAELPFIVGARLDLQRAGAFASRLPHEPRGLWRALPPAQPGPAPRRRRASASSRSMTSMPMRRA